MAQNDLIENKNINNTACAEINNENSLLDKQKNYNENTESSADTGSISTETVPQSACEQAPRHTDEPFRSKDIVAQYPSDDSEKNTKNISFSHSPHAEILLQRQVELREHIDREFSDINQYMLELVEGVKE